MKRGGRGRWRGRGRRGREREGVGRKEWRESRKTLSLAQTLFNACTFN